MQHAATESGNGKYQNKRSFHKILQKREREDELIPSTEFKGHSELKKGLENHLYDPWNTQTQVLNQTYMPEK